MLLAVDLRRDFLDQNRRCSPGIMEAREGLGAGHGQAGSRDGDNVGDTAPDPGRRGAQK